MPILDMTLRRPDSIALRYLARASAGSAPARAAASAISAYTRHGLTALAPYPIRAAMWWTSRASPVSAIRLTRIRSPRRMSSWCTAPTARSIGMGACAGSAPRSESTRIAAPSSTWYAASSQSRTSARSSPSPPSTAGKTQGRVRDGKSRSARRSASWVFVSSGLGSSMRRAWSGLSSRKLPRGPRSVTSDMTSRSRSGSIGGFVTCANRCLT